MVLIRKKSICENYLYFVELKGFVGSVWKCDERLAHKFDSYESAQEMVSELLERHLTDEKYEIVKVEKK